MSWPALTIGPPPAGMTVGRDPGWRTRRVVRYEHRIRNAEDGAFRARGLVGPSARPGGTRRALRQAPARPADRAARGATDARLGRPRGRRRHWSGAGDVAGTGAAPDAARPGVCGDSRRPRTTGRGSQEGVRSTRRR